MNNWEDGIRSQGPEFIEDKGNPIENLKRKEEMEEEVKKNKWIHGLCNPPMKNWRKEYE
jgi:hypothetical protein